MKDSIHVLINTCFQKSSLKGRWIGEEKMCECFGIWKFSSYFITTAMSEADAELKMQAWTCVPYTLILGITLLY